MGALLPHWFGRQERWAATALVLIATAALIHAHTYAGAVIDDAFITFRYSWNLVHGHGLTYNPGERVEGTSSPLFALAMALPVALGIDPYAAAVCLGSIAFVGCSVAAYLSVRGCVEGISSQPLALGAAIMVAASSSLAFHSQTGMETLVYACLVAFAICLQLGAVRHHRASASWAILMGLASLVRPEGFALSLLLWVTACVARLRRPGARAAAKAELTKLALIFGPWLLFRRAYFGNWFPNSVIAKSGFSALVVQVPPSEAWAKVIHSEGVAQVFAYFQQHAVGAFLAAGMFVLPQAHHAAAVVVGTTLTCCAVSAWTGGDWMPHDRLLVPCITPLAVGTALGLRGLFFHPGQRTWRGHLPSFVLAAAGVGFVVGDARRVSERYQTNAVDWPKMREIGKRLAPLTRDDDLVATDMAGMLPFYWGARVLDMYGLCDAHIARSGRPTDWGTGRSDPEYVIARRPTMYAFNFPYGAARFYQLPAFAAYRDEYDLLQFPYGYLDSFMEAPPTLFVRKDRPEAEHLASGLGAKLVDAGQELRRTGFLQ